jgi:hypothetical protein
MKDENLEHYWCECEELATDRDTYLGLFALKAEEVSGKSRTLLK